MFSLLLKITHRNVKRLVLKTLLYSVVSLFIFLSFYLPSLGVILSDPFRLRMTKKICSFLIFSSIFIFILEILINKIINKNKKTLLSIDCLPISERKKNFIFLLYEIYPSFYSVFISSIVGFIILIILQSSLQVSGTPFLSISAYKIILAILIVPLSSTLLALFKIYKKKEDLKVNIDYIALALFIINIFLLIFATKNDAVSIIFYFLTILLTPYAVLKLYSYIQVIRGNKKVNKKDYSALLFRRLVNRSFIIYLFLSFATLTSGLSNLFYTIKDTQDLIKYKMYDYEIRIDNEEKAIQSLSTIGNIRYTLISDSVNIKINDEIIPLYFTDLSMISEFVNIKATNQALMNKENTIILPAYFKNKYSLKDGDRIMTIINSKVRYLWIGGFIDEATDFIAYSYKIDEIDDKKTSVLINVFDKDFDIVSLRKDIESNNNIDSNFSRSYDRLVNTSGLSSYFTFISIIGSIVFLYFILRIDYYDSLKNTLKELYRVPVRNFLVKRMIYHDDFVVLSISTVIFILIESLIISFYNPDESSIYFLFFKNLKIQEFLLYILIIFVFYSLIFFVEYLSFNIRGDRYEERW